MTSAWAERRETVHGVFGGVAETYDATRPDYPPQLFDALESVMGQPLLRADVVDVGAGTGISSRALAGRGAHVVAVDPSVGMLAVLRRRTSVITAVRGRGEALPLRDACADLVAYAQSFHWADPARAVPEAARVLRPGGVLAAWWNLGWGDGFDWYEELERAIRAADPRYETGARDHDWGADLAAGASRPLHVARVEVPWTREMPTAQFADELRSHSNIATLPPDAREPLLAQVHAIIADAFPGGVAQIPYRTRLFAVRP